MASNPGDLAIRRLMGIFNVRDSALQDTRTLDRVRHSELIDAFNWWVSKSKDVFQEQVEVTVIQSLRDRGVDLILDFHESKIRCGVQIKSSFDISEATFNKNVHAQINQSRSHALKRLFVVFAGDMTKKSPSEKVRGLTSELAENSYVTTISPEKTVRIYKAFRGKISPSKLIMDYDRLKSIKLEPDISEEYYFSGISPVVEDPKPFDVSGLTRLLDDYQRYPKDIATRRIIFPKIQELISRLSPKAARLDNRMKKAIERMLKMFISESDEELRQDWVIIIRRLGASFPRSGLKLIERIAGPVLRSYATNPKRNVAEFSEILQMLEKYSDKPARILLETGIYQWSDDAYRIFREHLYLHKIEVKKPGFLLRFRIEAMDRFSTAGEDRKLRDRFQALIESIDKTIEILKQKNEN